MEASREETMLHPSLRDPRARQSVRLRNLQRLTADSGKSMNETLAKLGVASQPILLGLSLAEIEATLRIASLLVGIAVGVATFIYYVRRK